jgi:ABC-2 type transport system ATP-binding protein
MSLQIDRLYKRFGGRIAVNHVSIQAAPGKAFGLLGRNGAGKTTTIRSILGIIEFDSGEIIWNDSPIKVAKPKIGYLPEERGLYPKATVEEQLVYFGKLEGMSKKVLYDAIEYWLNRFDIKEYQKNKIEELSKGNQQKVQIISILIHDPELVILDEPFSGLDPINAELLIQVIHELLEKGKTLVISSHQMNHIEDLCETVCILKNGQTVVSGDLKEIKKSHGNRKFVIHTDMDIENNLNQLGVSGISKTNHVWRLTLPEHLTAQQLLTELVKSQVVIKKFEIEEPTLSEIFIHKAGDYHENF